LCRANVRSPPSQSSSQPREQRPQGTILGRLDALLKQPLVWRQAGPQPLVAAFAETAKIIAAGKPGPAGPA